MGKQRRVFSFVELMTVILVVALLVGLLLPAVFRARELSRRSSCAGNMKQIGLALLFYAGEYDSQFLNLPVGNSFVGISPKYTESTCNLFSCPSASNALTSVACSNYTYRGHGLKDDNASSSAISLAYDTSGNHPSNKWMNLLFVDGHVTGGQPGTPPFPWLNN